MIRRNLLRLFDKYTTGTATPEERAFLEAWFNALNTRPSFRQNLTDEEMKNIEQELFSSILQRIEQLRYQNFELRHQVTGDLGHNPELFQEKYIELIKHPVQQSTPVHPFLPAVDVCFQPMLPHLPIVHRQILTWSQLDRLSLQELAVKLRLTTSGTRARLQRSKEKLVALVRRCCIYQYDATGNALSCIIHAAPGCCESATSTIQ